MRTFKTNLITFSWIGGILFILVCTMWVIGFAYHLPEKCLFTDIFKVLFVTLIPTTLVWIGAFFYGLSNDKI